MKTIVWTACAALAMVVLVAGPMSAAPTLTTLHEFNGADGVRPYAGLIADAAGNLYGTTEFGGASDQGTIFRLDAGTNALTTLHEFNGGNGANPLAGLVADAAGNLYGTTQYGGAFGFGTVFRLDAGTNALTTLHAFSGPDGLVPRAGLVADAAGNLYGTTELGGAFSVGTVFRLDAGTNALTTLHAFSGADGAYPLAGLVADAAGNLYGTTQYGGAFGVGTVFRLDAGTSALTTLHEFNFNGADGARPYAGLIADAAGNLYGTTAYGGASGVSGVGTVFRLDAGTSALTTLHEFNGADGAYPYASLIADAAGNLYGTTVIGGALGHGTVFRLSDTGFVVIPEPAAWLLAAIGASALACRRGWQRRAA